MQINAQPLEAYKTQEIEDANGQPKMLVAVEVTQIGESNVKKLNQDSSGASGRVLPRMIMSTASLRSLRTKGNKNRKGDYTIASPDDYNANGKNNYSLGGGDDHHYGGKGRDIVTGGSGDDRLIGLGGNDVLKGGTGSDVIYGGSGKNTLSGGSGEDYYVIEKHNTKRGTHHTILDPSSDDVLVFSGYAPDDIKTRKRGRIFVDGRNIVTLKGASDQLTDLLVSEAIFN